MKNSILETKMVRYRDLLDVYVEECGEPLLALSDIDIRHGYIKPMVDRVIPAILVRQTVREKLLAAQKQLQKRAQTLSLFVTYGYRRPEIQTRAFQKELISIAQRTYISDPTDLYETIHRRIAVPTVAGHPTGGAIDVILIYTQSGKFVDCGSELYDFSTKKSYVFGSRINRTARTMRMLLRDCMLSAEFAPFDGEWWHFSFGDREWAYYYQKPKAIYDQISRPEVSYRTIRS